MNCHLSRRDLLFGCAAVAATASAQHRRLKRSESYLGVHFDFHAGPDCTEVGKNTTPAMIERIIDLIHPDYLQIDCKGHAGYTSYPTKAGNPAPGFAGSADPLRVWREVTGRRGVALYIHYSGVLDGVAATRPGWAAIKSDGKPHEQATSLFGPYVDQLMIPQLREIANYGVDGVWVDGDCWGAIADYSAAALKAFREETGIMDDAAPRKPDDPHWREFLEFHRRTYRRYLRHYVTEVKKTNPTFQICSNWAFTDHMPEPVTIPVDFLSGDFEPQNSVNSARMAGRYLVRQGNTWDLMAWSFSMKPIRKQKTVVQLQREAAVVIALGGGFQAYYTQNRDGSVRLEELPVMAEVARFCRARQALCHHAEPVPQVGVLFSTPAHYRRQAGLFSRNHQHVDGVLHALIESQHSVELVSESQLASGRMALYQLIVVPEWEYLEPDFRASLVEYVKAGGTLLLIGPKAAGLFVTELRVTLGAAGSSSRLHYQGNVSLVQGGHQSVSLSPNVIGIGELVGEGSTPAASIGRLGKGHIAAMYFNCGQAYREAPDEGVRRFLDDLVRKLFPNPMVEVRGGAVDVSVARNHGKLLVNLVNTSGPHRTEPIVEAIPPVGPLVVTIRLPKRPAKVTLEPSGQVLEVDYQDGKAIVTVPRIEIHEAVVVPIESDNVRGN